MYDTYPLNTAVPTLEGPRPLTTPDLFIHLLGGRLLSTSGKYLPWPALEALNVTQLLNANLQLSEATGFATGTGRILCAALLIEEYSKHWEPEVCQALALRDVESMEKSFGEIKLDRIFEPLSSFFLPAHKVQALKQYTCVDQKKLPGTSPLYCRTYLAADPHKLLSLLSNPDHETLAALQFTQTEQGIRIEDCYVPPELRRKTLGTTLLSHVTGAYTNAGLEVSFSSYITRRPDVSKSAAPLLLKQWDSFEAWTGFMQSFCKKT